MFSKREALSFGWQTFKAHWGLLLGVTVTSGLVSLTQGYLASSQGNQGWSPVIINFVFWLLQIIVALGYLHIALLLTAKKQARYSDLFSQYRLVLHYLIGSILYGAIVAIGLVLLIVPGIIFAIRMQLWSYFVVDKHLGPIAALRGSWKITHGSAFNLLLFDVLIGLITALGAMLLGFGLLVAVPVTALATAWVYRKLAST